MVDTKYTKNENEITKKYGILELLKPENYNSKDLYIAKFKFPKKLNKEDYYTIVYKRDNGDYIDVFYDRPLYWYNRYVDYQEMKVVQPIEKCKQYIECDKDLVKTFCKLNKINPNKKIICTENSNGHPGFYIIRELNIYIVKKDNKINIFIGITEDNYLLDVLKYKSYSDVKILAKIPLVAYLKGYPKIHIPEKDIENALNQFISEYNSKNVGYAKFKEITKSSGDKEENKSEINQIKEKQKEKELINSLLTSIMSLNERIQRLEKLNNSNNNIMEDMEDIYHKGR